MFQKAPSIIDGAFLLYEYKCDLDKIK